MHHQDGDAERSSARRLHPCVGEYARGVENHGVNSRELLEGHQRQRHRQRPSDGAPLEEVGRRRSGERGGLECGGVDVSQLCVDVVGSAEDAESGGGGLLLVGGAEPAGRLCRSGRQAKRL